MGSDREADGERGVLRYAVASSAGTIEFQFHARHAAYTGPGLLVVAEGFLTMSSPGSASAIAVEELRRLDVRTDAAGLTASLERGMESLRETFRGLFAADRGWEGTGTMLTAMLWRDTHAAIAHIGDTRAYLLRGGELTQLTRDHTIGQLLIDEGAITPDELGSDPKHALIIRCLDGQHDLPADITGHEAAAGDRYLLCTSVDPFAPPRALRETLEGILREERDLQDAADRVVAAAFPATRFGGACIVADVAPSRGPGR